MRDRRNRVQRARASGNGSVHQWAGDQHDHHYYAPGSEPPPQSLASLPAAPAHLVGRADETHTLLDLLEPGVREAPAAVVVSAVHGLGGIGKTALALHVAHEAVSRGWFPGGALFVPMRGYDPVGPVTAAQAVGMLLRALGVRDEHLPPTPDEQAGLYQSELGRLADQGTAVLVIADDVSAAAQVRPLIPGRGVHRLLVTSRDTLASLPAARHVGLDELAAGPAADLIRDALTRARPGDDRPAAEAAALAEVVAHCGRLPLALEIVAAILIGDPGLTIASMAADLADERTRLEKLRYDDGAGNSMAVRAAFELSYRRLDRQQSLMFRLVSLNSGPDVATEAAAALIARPADEARPVLAALARAGLLNESPIGSGRWRMHDLIAVYAAELARHKDRDRIKKARGRLLKHYLVTAEAADAHFCALPGEPVPENFASRAEALAWLDAERPNLVAAVIAAAPAHPYIAMSLTESLHAFLHWRRHFDDAVTVGELAVAAARHVGQRHCEGAALSNLGGALQEVRRFDEAIDAHTQAVAITRTFGDRHGEGVALNNLGGALQQVRRFDEAIDAHTQAVAIYHERGDLRSEGEALSNLGLALEDTQRLDEAIDAHTQAVAIARTFGDRSGEGRALNNLGGALQEAQRLNEAIDACTQAVAIQRESGDRHGEGRALNTLGIALQEAYLLDEAIDAHTQAAAIFAEFGDRHNEGRALANLGPALTRVRRFQEATDACTQAAAIFAEHGDRHNESEALGNLVIIGEEARRHGGMRGWWRAVRGRSVSVGNGRPR